MGVFRLVCVSVHHVDHRTQAVLIRVRDCCKAERLFRPGNRVQHLGRRGDWPLGRNKYQSHHRTCRKQRGRYNQAAGHGNALQLPRNSLAVLAAKDNGDRTREPKPLSAPSWLVLDHLIHWYQCALGFRIIRDHGGARTVSTPASAPGRFPVQMEDERSCD